MQPQRRELNTLPSSTSPVQVTSSGSRLRRLPLVTLYLTERCNSRCVTCDYWRHGRDDMSLGTVGTLLPSLRRLGTRVALISGGEPLLNPDWQEIAGLLRSAGIRLWLLTSGLSLAKHAGRVAEAFDAVTVSLDGTDRQTYAAIRGLDAFDKVCEGIRETARAGAKVGIRVTLQKANYRELPGFVELAHVLGAHSISFLSVDVANPHAFGRSDDFTRDLALQAEDLPVFAQLITGLTQQQRADFESRFIAESPAKLWRLHQYFAAVLGRAEYPPVHCNAPEFSAVLGVRGHPQPCFFISGPQQRAPAQDLQSALNAGSMMALRESIRSGERAECARCVCSLYRDPQSAEESLLP
jgi:Fe-coproporphyrin III synthase